MTTKKRSTNSSKQTIKSRRPAREGSLSTHTEKAQASLKRALPVISLPARIKPIIYAFILALIIVVGGWLFYSRIYINPQRVFATMISNNLSTDGFTRQTTQSACVPNAQSTNIIQTSFTPSLTLHCITHINNGSVRLVIESIGTTQADYQHYKHVQTSLNEPKVDKFATVYGMWLKNSGNDNGQPNLYGQLLNTPVLFGNFNDTQKKSLLNNLLSLYQVDYTNVSKQNISGRKIYTYNVAVPLKKFATAEKYYSDLLKLPLTSRINPQTYPSNSKVDVKFSVDVLSRQLREVQFQTVKEDYSGYGISPDVKPPQKTVSLQVLQSAFQSVSK